MKREKAYIMSTPAAGKSTFCKLHKGNYKGIKLFDHDELEDENDYNALYKLPKNCCILGKCHEPNTTEFIYVSVLLDEEVLKLQIQKRKNRWKGGYWANKDNIFNHETLGYNILKKISIKYDIPIYNNFDEALDYINERLDIIQQDSFDDAKSGEFTAIKEYINRKIKS